MVDGAIREGRRVDAGLGEGSRRREKAGEARERWRVVAATTAENGGERKEDGGSGRRRFGDCNGGGRSMVEAGGETPMGKKRGEDVQWTEGKRERGKEGGDGEEREERSRRWMAGTAERERDAGEVGEAGGGAQQQRRGGRGLTPKKGRGRSLVEKRRKEAAAGVGRWQGGTVGGDEKRKKKGEQRQRWWHRRWRSVETREKMERNRAAMDEMRGEGRSQGGMR